MVYRRMSFQLYEYLVQHQQWFRYWNFLFVKLQFIAWTASNRFVKLKTELTDVADLVDHLACKQIPVLTRIQFWPMKLWGGGDLEIHLRYDICNEARQIEKMHMHIILWNRGKYSQSHWTEIEKNSCISICTRSDLNKIREETIKKYNFIDRSNHAKVYHFANNSVMASMETVSTLNCCLIWEEK